MDRSKHAETDAKERSRPRGRTKFLFLNGKTVMCDLCGQGYGRPHTKSSRQFHEESPQHEKKYKQYVEDFDLLREAYLLWLADTMKHAHLDEAQHRMKRLNQRAGLDTMDLLHTLGDLVPLKVALADMLLAKTNVEQNCTRALLAVQKHVHFSKVLLVHGIASNTLAENTDGAYTVAQLLIPYVCTETRIETS